VNITPSRFPAVSMYVATAVQFPADGQEMLLTGGSWITPVGRHMAPTPKLQSPLPNPTQGSVGLAFGGSTAATRAVVLPPTTVLIRPLYDLPLGNGIEPAVVQLPSGAQETVAGT
jgi:hypothetical protein